jgi:hypothetical protein
MGLQGVFERRKQLVLTVALPAASLTAACSIPEDGLPVSTPSSPSVAPTVETKPSKPAIGAAPSMVEVLMDFSVTRQ